MGAREKLIGVRRPIVSPKTSKRQPTMSATINNKISIVKIDPRIKVKMQQLVASKDLEDNEAVDFLMEFIEECMKIEVPREKREKKEEVPKEKDNVKFSKVSAYNMFKRAYKGVKKDDIPDWKSMSDEDKSQYIVMAEEENAKRREKAESGSGSGSETDATSVSSGTRKTSGYHLFLKNKNKGEKWSDLSDDAKEEWKLKAEEVNKDIVVEKKPKEVNPVKESYDIALRYIRKKYSGDKFHPWKTLPLSSKQNWNEFVTDKLLSVTDKQLKKELIVAGADTLFEEWRN